MPVDIKKAVILNMEVETLVDETVILKGWNITRAYAGCLSWVWKKKGTKILLTKSPSRIEAYQSGTRHNPAREKFMKINLTEEMKCVSIQVALCKPKRVRLKLKTRERVVTDEFDENRKMEWQRLVNDLEQYLNGLQIQRGYSEVRVVSNIKKAFMYLWIPRAPLLTVTDVIYEKLPPISKVKSLLVLLISIGLFLGFYLYYFWLNPTRLISNALYLVATYGVAVLFLYWVCKSDRYEREPLKLVILAFAWGVFSGVIAAPLNRLFGPYFEILGTDALVAAFVEEPVKAIGLYFIVNHKTFRKEFNNPLDGIVYGFAVGIGFFAMENFMYFLMYGFGDLIIRSLYCWGHGVYVAITGLWLAIAKVMRGRIKIIDLLPGLLVAVCLHFLWNGWFAWFEILLGEKYGSQVASNIIYLQAVYQLGFLVKSIREALRDEELWGYATGSAPVKKPSSEKPRLLSKIPDRL